MHYHSFTVTLALALFAALPRPTQGAEEAVTAISAYPDRVVLHGQGARQQLVIMGSQGGRAIDMTRQVRFLSEAPRVAQVSAAGVVTPAADGETAIVAEIKGQRVRVPVAVTGAAAPLSPIFERDVQPILTRAACNAGSCHGKARGQNGFQLSLLGFDDNFDYDALTKEARGRRIFPAAPEQSLLLLKATGQVPHGGGKRLAAGEHGYEVILRWIASGAPRALPDTPVLEAITVSPTQRIMTSGEEQQLQVTARYSDGSRRDVTHLATFQSNESVMAAVDPGGVIRAGSLPGQATIMARFMDKFAVCQVLMPLPGTVDPALYATLPRRTFIDGHVYAQLELLRVVPSAPASEATFLRRAHLDLIGRLPTPQEVRTYLADGAPDKRAQLIDRLLERPEYADFWASKWADLLRPNPYRVGIKAVYNLDAWLRDAFRRNKPYDQFVREILTARGSTFRHGATVVFRDRRDPAEITTMMSQLFLGIRLDCARCHQHPFEVWGQDDFYSLAAYFGRIGRKGTGLSPPISGSEEMVFTALGGEVKHPGSGQVMTPRPLFGEAPVAPDQDPREALARWITAPENPYFARVIVNRVWADLMGRGLVEPVDDLRATNPPSNPALLDALAERFRQDGYDLKKLLRLITSSYVYGLSSEPTERNAADARGHSRHYRQRLRAEVLLDAVSDITGVGESFDAMPLGSRAMEMWTVRSPSLFLDSFGRPDPNQDPPCERTTDTTVVQALHLMNAENLHRKVTSDRGRAAQLAAGKMTPAEIVEELYLLVYSRLPDEEERRVGAAVFSREGVSRRQATEDLMWALLNTPELVFKN